MVTLWGSLESLSKKSPTSSAYPKEVPQGEGEANSQGHRAHAAIPPLVIRGKDAEHKLERQEDLHSGGLAHADPSVQLVAGGERRQLLALPRCYHLKQASSSSPAPGQEGYVTLQPRYFCLSLS